LKDKIPLVSIIIPCYNALPYLKETIKSALNQTYPDIEVIVIDDGSTDGSYEYVKNLNYPNIILKRNQRKGACAARNYGFELSHGQYIQFLDADDLINLGKIEKQLRLISINNDRTLISCPWGKFENIPSKASFNAQKVWKTYNNPTNWLIDAWNGGGMMQTACWLMHRKLILEAGPWDESLENNPNDDGEFFCRTILKSTRIVFDKNSKVYYRTPGKTNVSQNKSFKAIESLLGSYKSYEVILKHKDDTKVKRALAKNYNRFIYEHFFLFPKLSKKAKDYILELEQEIDIPFSNRFIYRISKWFGWKNVMILRKMMKGY
jgi:glycosyltransferase involved in cell wall biosynthesis